MLRLDPSRSGDGDSRPEDALPIRGTRAWTALGSLAISLDRPLRSTYSLQHKLTMYVQEAEMSATIERKRMTGKAVGDEGERRGERYGRLRCSSSGTSSRRSRGG
jgi:hypothetical protein